MKILYFVFLFSLTSCTYSITQIHTQGNASDIVDDTNIPTVSNQLTAPMI